MPQIRAGDIWELVRDSTWCKEARKFFAYRSIQPDKLLKRGAANFDQKIGIHGEKPWYRAAYYAGPNGYMDMHIRQNRAVFEHHGVAETLKNKRTLFVDFGCGPMTSGVVLADMLSTVMTDYKEKVFYVGIDRSENMCKIANKVNNIEESSRIFDRFHILNEDSLDPQKICQLANDDQPEIAVLCLSYVMAPDTYSKDQSAAVCLARKWKEIFQCLPECQETLVVYLNPRFDGSKENWVSMRESEFRNQRSTNWRPFEVPNTISIPVDGLSGFVHTQLITGRRI